MTTQLFKISFALCLLEATHSIFFGARPIVSTIVVESCNYNRLDTSKIIGKWTYSNTIWYHSELTFESNGKFIFHDQGCYGQEFTKGKWFYENDTISLQSFDAFKDKGDRMLPKSNMKKRKTKSGNVIYSFTFDKSLLPTSKDTIKVYFSNVRLRIKGDTLYSFEKNKFINGSKFTKTKNNR